MVEEAESTMSMMTTMIAPAGISGSVENPRNPLIITGPSDSPSPTWKLYDNPHYSVRRLHCNNNNNNNNIINNKHHSTTTISSRSRSSSYSNYHNRHLSSRSPMHVGPSHVTLSDLDNALAEIKNLRSELEFERRMRRKVEAANKALTRDKEAAEERSRLLTEELACVRREMEKAAKEAEEERRMLRMAEALREERVQMKLTEARMMMEDKIKEMNTNTNNNDVNSSSSNNNVVEAAVVLKGKEEGSSSGGDGLIVVKKEVENPHIKRGIKGMEFPRAVRVRGNGMGSSPSSREGRGGGQLGSNLECQRAQLRVLMRHKSPASSGLMGFAQNLVM